MRKIPVIILSGSLGSGKTTFLLRLLEETPNYELKCAVLINELGKINIDGAIISHAANKQKIESVLDGCICCSKKSEITNCFEKLLQQKPDVIFVELTGVANPEEIIDALNERELIAKVYVEQIISIVDAEQLLESNIHAKLGKRLRDTYKRQIKTADIIILNKIDLVNYIQSKELERNLSNKNGNALILSAMYGNIELDPIFKAINLRKNKLALHNSDSNTGVGNHREDLPHHHPHLSYSHLTTIALPVFQPMDKRTIEAFLDKWKSQIIRAKGLVPLASEKGTYLIQYVHDHKYWKKVENTNECYFVIIGVDLEDKQIKQEWSKL